MMMHCAIPGDTILREQTLLYLCALAMVQNGKQMVCEQERPDREPGREKKVSRVMFADQMQGGRGEEEGGHPMNLSQHSES